MIDYFSEIKDFHKNFVEPYKGKPPECSETEIKQLEDYFGFEFPLAYK